MQVPYRETPTKISVVYSALLCLKSVCFALFFLFFKKPRGKTKRGSKSHAANQKGVVKATRQIQKG
jgi:hypothetical protein